MATVEIPDELVSLFTASVDECDGSYTVELPESAVRQGGLERDGTYRIAVLPTAGSDDQPANAADGPTTAHHQDRAPTVEQEPSGPPVETGETREVHIEDIGEQGDGIARVEHGYVIIVPETEPGDTVAIEITHVQDNVAFADVVGTGGGG